MKYISLLSFLYLVATLNVQVARAAIDLPCDSLQKKITPEQFENCKQIEADINELNKSHPSIILRNKGLATLSPAELERFKSEQEDYLNKFKKLNEKKGEFSNIYLKNMGDSATKEAISDMHKNLPKIKNSDISSKKNNQQIYTDTSVRYFINNKPVELDVLNSRWVFTESKQPVNPSDLEKIEIRQGSKPLN